MIFSLCLFGSLRANWQVVEGLEGGHIGWVSMDLSVVGMCCGRHEGVQSGQVWMRHKSKGRESFVSLPLSVEKEEKGKSFVGLLLSIERKGKEGVLLAFP